MYQTRTHESLTRNLKVSNNAGQFNSGLNANVPLCLEMPAGAAKVGKLRGEQTGSGATSVKSGEGTGSISAPARPAHKGHNDSAALSLSSGGSLSGGDDSAPPQCGVLFLGVVSSM